MQTNTSNCFLGENQDHREYSDAHLSIWKLWNQRDGYTTRSVFLLLVRFLLLKKSFELRKFAKLYIYALHITHLDPCLG